MNEPERLIPPHGGYPPDKQEEATTTVLDQAELLCADWAEGLDMTRNEPCLSD
ncbi:MAG: hypothetical protein ABSA47_00960 [Verrucomicrobiota bacterium]|jgi:hypothetical protein